MGVGMPEERTETSTRPGNERIPGEDADARRQARLAAERDFPGFEFIDLHAYEEGELLGFYVGVPFNWSISSPELMWGPD